MAIFFAIYASLRMVNKDVERLSGPGPTDEIMYEEALQPLRHKLPANAIVGYITQDSAPQKTKNFYLTQYALCPVLVSEGINYPLIVGGYYSMNAPDVSEFADFSVIDDFKNGIYLLEKREK
jgi:hypothetical protein